MSDREERMSRARDYLHRMETAPRSRETRGAWVVRRGCTIKSADGTMLAMSGQEVSEDTARAHPGRVYWSEEPARDALEPEPQPGSQPGSEYGEYEPRPEPAPEPTDDDL